MSLNAQEIRQVLEALEASDWDEAQVTIGDVSISVARKGFSLPGGTSPVAAPPPPAVIAAPVAAAPVAVVPPAAPSPAPEVRQGLVSVTSPTVGIMWRAPEPGAAPFIHEGQHVDAGDIICIVEVMKLMNNVVAPVTGTVAQILVENAGAVEFDQVLVTIEPQAS